MNFWDTSALVRCAHPDEIGHERAKNLFEQKVRQSASAFLRLECTSAVVRTARSSGERSNRLRWLRVALERFSFVDVRSELLDSATRLAERHRLRAGDALHVATALDLNMPRKGRRSLVFVTCDADQALAASAEGLRVLRPDA